MTSPLFARARVRRAPGAVFAHNAPPVNEETHQEDSEALWRGFRPVPAPLAKVVDHIEHVMKIAPGATPFPARR